MTSVLIVVLNWNGIEDTEKCVQSLIAQDYPSLTIAIVDNGSKDDSVPRLKTLAAKHSKKVHLLFNQTNLGFDGGVNTGIRYGLENNFDAIALFNNDATADVSWLSNLVKNLSDEVSIVTGLLLHADGKTIDSSGDFYSSWGIGYPRNRGGAVTEAPESGLVFGGSGGATLYKSVLFREIGLFDETFFAYYEDVDISFRAQLAGHKAYYAKDAIAYHEQGASSSKIPGFTVYQNFKNLPLLFWKNIPTRLLFRIGIRFALLYTLIFGNALKNGSGWPAFRGVIASVWYFWTDALWQRLRIQANRKVDASYIWSLIYKDIPPEQTGMRKFRDFFRSR